MHRHRLQTAGLCAESRDEVRFIRPLVGGVGREASQSKRQLLAVSNAKGRSAGEPAVLQDSFYWQLVLTAANGTSNHGKRMERPTDSVRQQ